MSKLDAKSRNALATSEFAEPAKRAYPIEDPSHARNALARVAQHGTPAEKAQVDAAVHRKFPGIGAKVQGRSGQSLEHMATRMHGKT